MEETRLIPIKVEYKKEIYKDRNQKIQRVLAHFDGFDKEYFVSDHGKRAALLAVRNGNILLVRQYRLIINDLSYEIPGRRWKTKGLRMLPFVSVLKKLV